jgi:cytochrome c oxidase subunit 4
MSSETAQEHPLSIYFIVWGALFVLSTFSYLVDYLEFQGYLRWILILTFMWLKAGAIVAVFMHMRWERPALVTVILVPPLCLMVLVGMMAIEGGYTTLTRVMFFATP